ncbi:MAG: undecaprenyl-diphosphate phosphatase [Pseudomonadota bacterium]
MNELSILKAVLLGAIQGATEFLPVSSSGHLTIAQSLLGVKLEGGGLLAFDVCLHFGTLLAVIIFFRRELWQIIASIFRTGSDERPQKGLSVLQARRLGLMIIIGTIPAVIVGPLLNDYFEQLVSNAMSAAFMLLITGAILWGTRWVRVGRIDIAHMGFLRAFLVGIAQAIAIIPGISRSGSTISAGLYLGIDRDLSARFAFLLAVPAIAGATIFKLEDLANFSHDIIIATIAGTVIAAVVGFACIKWLLGIVRRGHISWFAPYCWTVGIATIIYSLMK